MKLFLLLASLFMTSSLFASFPESEDLPLTSIPNQYIIGFSSNVDIQSFKFLFDEHVIKTYPVLNAALVETKNPRSLQREGISYIEANETFRITETQTDSPWGLDRIDSRSGIDSKYQYSETGNGVHVYVIDTGVKKEHVEFEGRIENGYSAINGSIDDCNGHGTHVSGIILGSTYGVAKKATLHPVRTLDCRGIGTLDNMLSGLEWIATNAQLPAVANMSFSGNNLRSINTAVSKIIEAGVTVVAAAGNSSDDACKYSPSSVREAITVAAMDINDTHANFSNFGSCVDIYAPGVNILSASTTDNQSSTTMSGTSMAAPHVAGVAALLLEKKPSSTPTEITKSLISDATRSLLNTVPSGTANLLVFTNPDLDDSTPKPDIPVECTDSWACYIVSKDLTPTKYYDQQPKDPIVVNYVRPISIYVSGDADFDIYLYHSTDGQKWTIVSKASSTGLSESLTHQATERGLYTSIIMLKTAGTSGKYNAWIVK